MNKWSISKTGARDILNSEGKPINGREMEQIVRESNSHDALVAALERTNDFALELMERTARLDRKLAESTGATLDCELGEIVRLRQQLGRNRQALTLARKEEK